MSKLATILGAISVVFSVAILTSGCAEWQVPEFENNAPPADVSIADLRAYYAGNELVISDDIVLRGRVTTSDLAGNFYNSFFVDDGTGAVEIMAGISSLSAIYHLGQLVTVRAKNLAVGWRDGAMQLGLPPGPGNRYPTAYFSTPAMLRRHVSTWLDVRPVAPLETPPEGLTEAICGRLVRISGLVADPFLPENSTWATPLPDPETGYVNFFTVSAAEPVITVVTSGYAAFSGVPVPRGEVSLTGILLYNGRFLLKLRDAQDVEYQ
jgi:hypothetical protein